MDRELLNKANGLMKRLSVLDSSIEIAKKYLGKTGVDLNITINCMEPQGNIYENIKINGPLVMPVLESTIDAMMAQRSELEKELEEL